jgi:hypothetical protein
LLANILPTLAGVFFLKKHMVGSGKLSCELREQLSYRKLGWLTSELMPNSCMFLLNRIKIEVSTREYKFWYKKASLMIPG